MRRPSVTALGGGHGLAASLGALRLITERITAVVTVADDGGSSGRLREELQVLPPGDLRMALSALCDDTEWGLLWRDVLQHRFEGHGDLGGHAVGNLLIASLWQLLGDTVAGLDTVGKLLGARGRVLPMAGVPLDIEATVRGDDPSRPDAVSTVRGQVAVATTSGHVINLRLHPADPPSCPEAVAAVDDADWVILGPGSWFTSVMPHLLVPGLRDALVSTRARKALTLNLALNTGETKGFSAADHLEVMAAHAPDLRLDVVLADPVEVRDGGTALRQVAAGLGASVVLATIADHERPGQHDPLRLAAAYRDMMDDLTPG